MSLEATFDEVAGVLNDIHGIDAVFTPRVGVPVSLKVTTIREFSELPGNMSGSVPSGTRRFELLYTDIGRLPLKGEKLTVGGVTYVIDSTSELQDERFVEVIVRG
jgi:hypothetical protein